MRNSLENFNFWHVSSGAPIEKGVRLNKQVFEITPKLISRKEMLMKA